MKSRNKFLIISIITLTVVINPAPVYAIWGAHYGVKGLNKLPDGSYEQWSGTNYYVCHLGLIWDLPDTNPADELDYYYDTMSDADYCSDASHKAGGEKFDHWHVESGVDFNTTEGWIGSDYYPSIEPAESNEYYDAVLLNFGKKDGNSLSFDNVDTEPNIDDGQDPAHASGNPNLTYNCYGYAFDKTGHSEYKLLVNDSGANTILDVDNGVYVSINTNTESTNDCVMHLSGSHANWVYDADTTGDCLINALKFKYRCSRIYTYGYWNQREPDDAFDGKDPDYYKDP